MKPTYHFPYRKSEIITLHGLEAKHLMQTGSVVVFPIASGPIREGKFHLVDYYRWDVQKDRFVMRWEDYMHWNMCDWIDHQKTFNLRKKPKDMRDYKLPTTFPRNQPAPFVECVKTGDAFSPLDIKNSQVPNYLMCNIEGKWVWRWRVNRNWKTTYCPFLSWFLWTEYRHRQRPADIQVVPIRVTLLG